MTLASMSDIDLNNQRVLIREDLNVPLHQGKISSDARIKAALPTIQAALDQNAAVMVMSHLGRPTEGENDPSLSLQPVADYLSNYMNQPVRLVTDWLNGIAIKPGELVVCENVRFNRGEKNNDKALSKKMAALCDVFVMDAFATAHRAQASTTGVAEFAPIACAGPLLLSEISTLQQALKQPNKPMAAIVGGSKISTKLSVLENLLNTVDLLIPGGGIANTFLKARDINIGQSLHEPDLIDTAIGILDKAQQKGVTIPLPIDVRVATAFDANAKATVKSLKDIDDNDMILDVGPTTAMSYANLICSANTIVWNGPLGVFEFPAFADGTRTLGEAIAKSHAFSIAGGGDTLAALDQFNLSNDISYISTGGGAFLELLEGKSLPAITQLEQRQLL